MPVVKFRVDPSFRRHPLRPAIIPAGTPAVLDSNGNLRVFFGGYSDDLQNTGPGNYEVSGVMTLKANQVPDADASLYLLSIALAGLLGFRRWVK